MLCRWLFQIHRSVVQPRAMKMFLVGLLAGTALSLGACSNSTQSASPALDEHAQGPNDPLEKGNRAVWAVDVKLGDYILNPVAKKYRDNVPDPVRKGVTNLLHNLESPVILLNDGLQGNGARAGDTFARIWLNTICGLGGLIDVGAASHIPFHEADFGQTLGVWGVGPGPYLVLPLFGPSDPRDLVGKGVDTLADPLGFGLRGSGIKTEFGVAQNGADVINGQSQRLDDMDELRRSSLDFYAAVRSLYQQHRVGVVREGKAHSAFASVGPGAMAGGDQQAFLPSDSLESEGQAMALSQQAATADVAPQSSGVASDRNMARTATKISHGSASRKRQGGTVPPKTPGALPCVR